MKGIYSLGIRLYGLAISLAAPFREKAARWKAGRKDYFADLPKNLEGCIWVHCASLGEYEQGRPMIEALKDKASKKILLTFFSPSGYEIRKDYEGADAVIYLPLDTPSNARRFLAHFRPSAAIFVKYEVWHHFFREAARQEIPVYMISAIFRAGQVYFKPYGKWFLDTLKGVGHIFCQDEDSARLLRSHGVEQVSVSGDTRFDRVSKMASSAGGIPEVEEWLDGRKALVAGSTWPRDEELLLAFEKKAPKNLVLIIAPHEINEQKIKALTGLFPKADLYSQLPARKSKGNVLIVDTIGLLGRLYRYGRAAYIGGGFGSGIHNTLEAAVYGIPVVFGPKHEKFKEAKGLKAVGGAFSVENQEEFDEVMGSLLEDDGFRRKAGNSAKDYVKENKGATQLIFNVLIGKTK